MRFGLISCQKGALAERVSASPFRIRVRSLLINAANLSGCIGARVLFTVCPGAWWPELRKNSILRVFVETHCLQQNPLYCFYFLPMLDPQNIRPQCVSGLCFATTLHWVFSTPPMHLMFPKPFVRFINENALLSAGFWRNSKLKTLIWGHSY